MDTNMPSTAITIVGRKKFYTGDQIFSEFDFPKVFAKDECYLLSCMNGYNF